MDCNCHEVSLELRTSYHPHPHACQKTNRNNKRKKKEKNQRETQEDSSGQDQAPWETARFLRGKIGESRADVLFPLMSS